MPLLEQQKEQIDSAIESFFPDGDLTLEQLLTFIFDLRTAFQDALEPGNELYNLQNCIFKPERYLRGIEKCNYDSKTEDYITITVGEIQQYIYEFTTKKLEEFTKKLNKNLIDFSWNEIEILNYLTEKPTFNKKYASKKLNVVNPYQAYNPHEIQTDDRMFNVKMFVRSNKMEVEVSLQLPDQLHPTLKTLVLPDVLNHDDEVHLILRLQDKAISLAETTVVKDVIHYLIQNQKLNRRRVKDMTSIAKLLLTYRYFFVKFIAGDLKLEEFIELEKDELDNLTQPGVVELLQSGQFSVTDICNLTKPDLKVLLTSGKEMVQVKKLQHLTHLASRNLSSPMILNLIKLGKLTYEEAAGLSMDGRKLLCHENYYQLFAQNKIKLSIISNATYMFKKLLLKPKSIKAFAEEQFGEENVNESNLQLWLNNDAFNYLHEKQFITFSEFKYFTYDTHLKWDRVALEELFADCNPQKMRILVQQFIQLSKHGFVNATDIGLLCNEAKSICSDMQLDEFLYTDYKILKHPTFEKHCYERANERLKNILNAHDDTLVKDANISKLISDCNKCNIPFKQIRDYQIDEAIAEDVTKNKNHKNRAFILYIGKELKLSSIEIWTKILAREFYILFTNPTALEPDAVIIKRIHTVSQQQHFDPLQLKLLSLSNLLRIFRNEIQFVEKQFTESGLRCPETITHLNDIINVQLAILSQPSITLPNEILQSAIDAIVSLTKTEQQKLRLEKFSPKSGDRFKLSLFSEELTAKRARTEGTHYASSSALQISEQLTTSTNLLLKLCGQLVKVQAFVQTVPEEKMAAAP